MSGVSPGALLVRGAGILLWRLAQPESLPVPEPGAEAAAASVRAPRSGGVLVRAATAVLTFLGLAVLGVGLVASLATRSLVAEFVHTSPGTPLSRTADNLAAGLEGSWWVALYPSLPDRLDRAAARLRAGEEDLTRLAVTYLRERDAVNRRGLPSRLLAGAAMVAPVDSALSAPRTPWHRGTLVYTEIEESLSPYREAADEAPNKVVATLFQAPPDHALVVTMSGSDGVRLVATSPLVVGESFSLPIVPGARVGLTTLFRPAAGGAYRVEAETTLRLEDWPQGEVTVPGSGGVQFRFDPEAVRRAPLLPDLTPAARMEIGLTAGEGGR